jgi:HAD superfamily hydrolase (TIGR01509 family)
VTAPDLSGIDLIVFDKDGTLIDFGAMWVPWIRELARRLEASSGRAMSADLFATVGFDPSTGRVTPGGPLSVRTMGEIHELVAAVLRRWCPSVAAARRATDAAWFVPEPAQAVPLAGLPDLFAGLRAGGRHLAVATADDRAATEMTLRALSIRQHVDALVCGDDGFAVKPAPDAVFAICQALRSEPSRCAIVGDTSADVDMGRAAGVAVLIGVLSGLATEAELASADVILETAAELRST